MSITPPSVPTDDPPLACPIDGAPLSFDGGSARCPNGHTYDRAKDGYWNLLLVQHKASRDPGDSKDMVAARRRVLEAGHFAPLADEIAGRVECLLAVQAAGADRPLVVDAGCGEGYYLQRIAERCTAAVAGVQLVGIDVSKWAVRAAARRTCPGSVTWAVANNRHPPFTAGGVDVMLCNFGFPVWQGFRGVQRIGGHVLLADPGADHLAELRAIIYPQVRRSEPPSLADAMAHGYRIADAGRVSYRVHLPDAAAIADLVAMTPHAHRMPAAGRTALAAVDHLDVTVDVALRLLTLTAVD